jgi:hypothetical protein
VERHGVAQRRRLAYPQSFLRAGPCRRQSHNI